MAVNCTILGAVSGEKRFQNINTHIGIQQTRNPTTTYDKTRLTLISCTETLPVAVELVFCKDGATSKLCCRIFKKTL